MFFHLWRFRFWWKIKRTRWNAFHCKNWKSTFYRLKQSRSKMLGKHRTIVETSGHPFGKRASFVLQKRQQGTGWPSKSFGDDVERVWGSASGYWRRRNLYRWRQVPSDGEHFLIVMQKLLSCWRVWMEFPPVTKYRTKYFCTRRDEWE